MQEVLTLVPETERHTVTARANDLAEDLRRWGANLDATVSSRLADRLAITVAAIAPHLDLHRVTLLTRYSLWTYLLDDLLDNPTADPAALDTIVQQLSQRTSSDSTRITSNVSTSKNSTPDLESGLDELLTAMSAINGATVILERLTTALRDAMDADLQHRTLARQIRHGHAVAPAAEDYLAVASRHVNYRSFAYALALLTNPAHAEHLLPTIDAALTPASRAVRLANDLRSIDRDSREGGLNILQLRHEDGAPVSEQAVRHWIDAEMRLSTGMLHADPTAAADKLLITLENSLRIAVGVYSVTDLR